MTLILETDSRVCLQILKRKMYFQMRIAYTAYQSSVSRYSKLQKFYLPSYFFQEAPRSYGLCSLHIFSSTWSFYRESVIQVFLLLPTKWIMVTIYHWNRTSNSSCFTSHHFSKAPTICTCYAALYMWPSILFLPPQSTLISLISLLSIPLLQIGFPDPRLATATAYFYYYYNGLILH